ncbi:hypothetical protein CVT24_011408 [Panaeolus cyanescens]|uniref:Fungal-type protein kinase domain-containing protein n=1 Tax=Panaeolus cyanescens TaxID=181874 RepID=A0A409VG62_9AGAR|nr:hypothetical protein CVT24_011408 [Panaeolus cyanescens]
MSPSNVLEGHHVEVLLSSTVSDVEVNKYLDSSPVYGSRKKDWTALPTVLKKHLTLCSTIFSIFTEIVNYFHSTDTPDPRPVPPTPCTIHLHPRVGAAAANAVACPDLSVMITDTATSLDWSKCVSFIDVITDDRVRETATQQSDRFHSFAEQCFLTQTSRLVVCGLVITETVFRLYRYDRFGHWVSGWVPYRGGDAGNLVKALVLISSGKGFGSKSDTGAAINQNGKHVFSLKKGRRHMSFTEIRLLSQSLRLPEASIVCWEVEEHRTHKKYLLKQCISACEHDDLGAELVGRLHGVKGVGNPSFSHTSKVPHDAALPDGDVFVHYKVFEGYGDTINNVQNRVQFLKALRSCISAHEVSFIDKRILHRDISINNILYPKESQDVTHGYLVDFEHRGIVIDAKERNTIKEQEMTGDPTFQSINLLRNKDPSNPRQFQQRHDYLDDLESFFWVFIWTTAGQLPPKDGWLRPIVPPPALHKDLKDPFHKELALQRCKDGRAHVVFDAEWGPEFMDLAMKLGRFFMGKLDKKRHLWKTGDLEGLMDRAQDSYSTVLGYFDEAIQRLEWVDLSADAMPRMDSGAQVDHGPDVHPQRKLPKRRRAPANIPASTSEKENEVVAVPVEAAPLARPAKRVRLTRATVGDSDDIPEVSARVIQPTRDDNVDNTAIERISVEQQAAPTLRKSKRLQQSAKKSS